MYTVLNMPTKQAGKIKTSNPVYSFRPSDEIWELLVAAQKATKRTKSSLVSECVERGLPSFIAATKAQSCKHVYKFVHPSGRSELQVRKRPIRTSRRTTQQG